MGLMKEMMKEIGNKSREFYEFVLPPIDMYLTDDNLKVIIDIPGFAKKDIELTYSIQSKNTTVLCDEYSLIQVFANLIDNAIKYTKKGTVSLLLYDTENGNLNVDVTDTGIGIDEEYLPLLFEPFSQEQHGYTRAFEGNGLGMAIVKGYCNINQLSISVKSKKNEGTTFTVSFPKKIIVK